jgi:ABC transporter related
MVKQPYISDLAKEMEIGGKVLSVEEFVENYKK